MSSPAAGKPPKTNRERPPPAPAYLYRRGTNWWWRRAVPRRLQPVLGESPLRRSTHSCNAAEARAAARRLNSAADAAFGEIFDRMNTLAQDQARALVGRALDIFADCGQLSRLAARAARPGRREAWEVGRDACALELGAGWLREALAANDRDGLSEVEAVLEDAAERLGLELPGEGTVAREELVEGAARGMIQLYGRLADEARGVFAGDATTMPPALPPWVTPPAADPIHSAVEGSAAAAPAAPAAGPTLKDAAAKHARVKEAEKRWIKKSSLDAKTAFRRLKEHFGAGKPLTAVSRQEAKLFRAEMHRLPARSNVQPFLGLTMPEQVELADRLDAAAEAGEAAVEVGGERVEVARFLAEDADGDARVPRLAKKTVKKNLSFAVTLFDDALDDLGLGRERNPFRGLLYSKEECKDDARPRVPWEAEGLGRLFRVGPWTPAAAGERGGRFWVPLIALFAGLRLQEACQLHAKDLVERDGGWWLEVKPGPSKRLKTPAAARAVPLHPQLERLGLVDHALAARAKGERRLFPELVAGGPDKTLADPFSKWFTALRQRHDLYEARQDFHSIRHNFNTALTRAPASNGTLVKVLMGHARGELFERDYFGGFEPAQLQAAVAAIDHKVDLSHL